MNHLTRVRSAPCRSNVGFVAENVDNIEFDHIADIGKMVDAKFLSLSRGGGIFYVLT